MTAVARRADGQGARPGKGDDVSGRAVATAAFVLILAVSVPWTAAAKGAEAPALVILKYPLTAAALFLAYRSRRVGTGWSTATRLIIAYCAVSAAGGLLGPSTVASLIRSGRLILVALTTVWCATRLEPEAVIRLYARVAALYSAATLLAFLVGLNPMASGRLRGFVPPIHPNNLGALAGLGALAMVSEWALGRRLTPLDFSAIPVLVLTLVLSGSRGSLLATGAGLMVAFVFPAARNRGVAVVYCILLLLTVDVFVGNPLSMAWSRDAEKGTALFDPTFTGRTKAWSAVVSAPVGPTALLVGRGLEEKTIPVRDKYAPRQPIHGSWLSAYFQAGLVGAVALASAFIMARRSWSIRSGSAVVTGVYVFLLVHSFFESALNDVSIVLPVFLVLIATSDQAKGSAAT
jgi:hypothetical protein